MSLYLKNFAKCLFYTQYPAGCGKYRRKDTSPAEKQPLEQFKKWYNHIHRCCSNSRNSTQLVTKILVLEESSAWVFLISARLHRGTNNMFSLLKDVCKVNGLE